MTGYGKIDRAFWSWPVLFAIAGAILILFLTLQEQASGQDKPTLLKGEVLDGNTIKVPDKDGSTYLVPFNDPGLLKAVRDKVAGKVSTPTATTGKEQSTSALDEVNALRARRGLRPFIFDSLLTQAAESCSQFRAANLIEGHTRNDFQFVPSGSSARSAGCAAWSPSLGWGSCCIYDNATYAGAGWTMGKDGRRYMHLFVR